MIEDISFLIFQKIGCWLTGLLILFENAALFSDLEIILYHLDVVLVATFESHLYPLLFVLITAFPVKLSENYHRFQLWKQLGT